MTMVMYTYALAFNVWYLALVLYLSSLLLESGNAGHLSYERIHFTLDN